MPRKARIYDQGVYNHITVRGSGRRRLFEDDTDKTRFRESLKKISKEESCLLFAWCLMDNHVHLLVQASVDSVSKMMQRICTSYAHWYNGRHGHIGHVFQGRYTSTPIMDEEHFIAAIKYIHLNPRDMGIDDISTYLWSSYPEYLQHNGLCQFDLVLGMLGGIDSFVLFHENEQDNVGYASLSRRRISDAEADAIAQRICGEHYRDVLPTLEYKERKSALARLKLAGLSIRQIERLTGIGRGVIAKAAL